VLNTYRSKLRLRLAVFCLCAFAVVSAYSWTLLLPFIGDDYVQIDLARRYGSSAGWLDLARDALYRCRATSILLTHWTELLFGVTPVAFKLSSLAIHVLNCLLVMGLGIWRPVGYRLSCGAALVFAFIERPHEAVIWYAALPELLVFTFSLLSFLAWVRWLQAPRPRPAWYTTSVLMFLLALVSKESAVCVTGLLILSVALEPARKRRHWYTIVPFVVLSLVYFASIYGARSEHLHFNDGTFNVRAPFWSTLISSVARLFWVWGMIGLAILALLSRLSKRFVLLIGGWLVITLLPYCFLTYMPRVPSRHTYLASVALALVLSAAAVAMWRFARTRGAGVRVAVAVCIAACFLQNTTYLWTRKYKQFQTRADVTQQILKKLSSDDGLIRIECFPHHPSLALLTVAIERPQDASRVVVEPMESCNAVTPEGAE
jgi:hypothetical protein